MKSVSYKKILLLCASTGMLLCACKKSGDTATAAGGFNWTWNSTNYTAGVKEAFLQSMSVTPIIIAGTGTTLLTPGSGPRISLTSFNTGSYTLNGSPANSITFIAPNGDMIQSTTGNLSITSSSNNKLSGSFSATLGSGGGLSTSSLSGSFSNITISQ